MSTGRPATSSERELLEAHAKALEAQVEGLRAEVQRLQALVDNAVMLSAKNALLRAGLAEVAGLDCSRYTKYLDAQEHCSCVSCSARKALRDAEQADAPR